MYIYVIILIEKYAGIIIVSDCTDEPRKAESCLQFKMKKHHIKTGKISHKHSYVYVWARTRMQGCMLMRDFSSFDIMLLHLKLLNPDGTFVFSTGSILNILTSL